MILQGNQRGGAKNLAIHLMKQENEHVDIHEIRGFASGNLMGAFNEAYAISRGTRAKQFLFSLSLNPPPTEQVATKVFENAIARVETKLGLQNQPRAIVFHEKEGRRHCHTVWSRIDQDQMKAIPLSFTKRKLMDISRELYLEQGWKMPRGLMQSEERDLRNFTLAQWQQAKRQGKDPRAIKAVFQECWSVSDNQRAFAHALKERGYTLAKGDRRGFVALDHRCEVYAVSKWVGIKTKEVRSKLVDAGTLPSVEDARTKIAKEMAERLSQLKQKQQEAINARMAEVEDKRLQLVRGQQKERQQLEAQHHKRAAAETLERQRRFSRGLRGLFDFVTGKRKQIRKQNELESAQANLRDRKEKDALIFEHLNQRQLLQERSKRLTGFLQAKEESANSEINQYREIQNRVRDVFEIEEHKRNRDGPTRKR